MQFLDRGSPVVRDVQGEELYDLVKSWTSKKGEVSSPFMVFKGAILSVEKAEEGTEPYWIFSTADVDRSGDVVEQKWILDHYQKNPVILWAHNHSIPAIGFGKNVGVKDGALKGVPVFNPKEVDEFGFGIGERVRIGALRAGSVGFYPHKVITIEEQDGGRSRITGFRLSENDLWEYSICNVPANPFALRQSKSKDEADEGHKDKEQLPAKGPLSIFTIGGRA